MNNIEQHVLSHLFLHIHSLDDEVLISVDIPGFVPKKHPDSPSVRYNLQIPCRKIIGKTCKKNGITHGVSGLNPSQIHLGSIINRHLFCEIPMFCLVDLFLVIYMIYRTIFLWKHQFHGLHPMFALLNWPLFLPKSSPKKGLAQGAPVGGQLSQRTHQTLVW